MADRTVTVKLRVASAEFNAAMLKAGTSVKVLSSEVEAAGKHTKNAGTGMQDLSRKALIGGAALAVGFGAAVKVFADFDQQMSNVRAATQANAGDMDTLRDAAMQMGKATFFSATEAAQGEEELAKAGVSVTDIVHGGLAGALNLATAGQLSVADAAETAASAMTMFGLTGKDVPHVADVLAAAAGKAQGSVDDLRQGLAQSGLVANQTGLTFDDTSAVLAEFASNGLNGSDAGTSLKQMLLSLTPTSATAKAAIKELGISAYDSQGNFIGMQAWAGKLATGLAGMSAEQRQSTLSTIFGSDAVRAASIIYRGGSAGIADWTAKVNDSGYAARQAAQRMDNLNGDLEQLKGAFETAIIGSGSGANGVLRTMAQHLTNDVNALSGLPEGLQQVGMGIGLIGSGGLAAVGALGTMLPKFDQLQTSLQASGWSKAASGVGVLKNGFLGAIPVIGVAAVALDYFGQKAAQHAQSVTTLTAAIQADNGAMGENTRIAAANALQSSGAFDAANRLGISVNTVTSAALGNAAAIASVAAATEQYKLSTLESGDAHLQSSRETDKDVQAAEKLNKAISNQKGVVSDAITAARNKAEAVGTDAKAEDTLAAATDTTTTSMQAQVSASQQLAGLIDSLSGKALTAAQSQDSFRSSLFAMTAGVKEGGTSLSVHTQKGNANHAMILSLIDAANKHGQTVADETGLVGKGANALRRNETQIRASAKAAGFNTAQVDAMIKKYGQVPTKKEIKLATNLGAVNQNLATTTELISGLHDKTITITVNRTAGTSGATVTQNGRTLAGTQGQDNTYDPQHAAGGGLAEGWSTVGEQGWEAVHKSGGTVQVFSNAQSKRIMGQDRVPGYAGGTSGGKRDLPITHERYGWVYNGQEYSTHAKALKQYHEDRHQRDVDRVARREQHTQDVADQGNARSDRTTWGSAPGPDGDVQAQIQGVNAHTPGMKTAMTKLSQVMTDSFDLKKLNDKVDGWRTKLTDLKGAKIDLRNTVTGNLQQDFNQAQAGQDPSTGYVHRFSTILGASRAEEARVTKFDAELNTLRKKGLSNDLLAKYGAEGPSASLDVLAGSSAADIKRLNASAARLEGLQNKAGSIVANQVYDKQIASTRAHLDTVIAAQARQAKKIDDLVSSISKLTGRPVEIQLDGVTIARAVDKAHAKASHR